MVEPQEAVVEQPAIRVFISYSRESVDQENRVLALSDRLCREGIDAVLDQYVQAPSQGWAKWMLEHFEESNFIIVVCTEVYDRRSRGLEPAGIGKGVKFETLLTYQDLLDGDSKSERIIPVVFQQEDLEFIPRPLKPFQSYILETDAGYEALYRRLTGQPRIVKPPSSGIKNLSVGDNISAPTPESMLQGSNTQGQVARKVRRGKKTKMSTVEVHIDRNFEEYSEFEQQSLIRAIQELLHFSTDLRIKSIRRGSVILILELASKDVAKLSKAVKRGVLSEYGVLNIQTVPDTTSASSKSASFVPTDQGTVKWFTNAKAYGFIPPEKGDTFTSSPKVSEAAGYKVLNQGDKGIVDAAKDPEDSAKSANVTKKEVQERR